MANGSASGAVTLGEIAAQASMIEVACRKCERFGRLSTAKLLRQHGADTKMPDLLPEIARDCPRVNAHSIYDQCGAYYAGPHTRPVRQAAIAPEDRHQLAMIIAAAIGRNRMATRTGSP